MMRRLLVIIVAVVAVLTCYYLTTDRQGAVPEPSPIQKIMVLQKAPVAKVKMGNATAADKETLLELYTDLGKHKPPVGDADNWKTLTDNLVSASQDLVDGKDGATDEFLKAVDCAACHQAHRGH
jgi:hypothetical protein